MERGTAEADATVLIAALSAVSRPPEIAPVTGRPSRWRRPEARGAGHVVDCRIAGNEPVGGVWPSDHHAVLAELRY